MAKIVLGVGTSHGPMLSTPPDQWSLRVQADRAIRHWYRGQTYSFDELAALRDADDIPAKITTEEMKARHAACQQAIDELARIYRDARPDVAVIFGNDQSEAFGTDQIPAFLVYGGDELFSAPMSEEVASRLEPGIAVAQRGFRAPNATQYPGHPALAEHITRTLIEADFDVAFSRNMPRAGLARDGQVPHAFGFVYERIMRGQVIPNVPLFTNTFYPPNTPKVRRCLAMADAVRKAIESWDSDLRVVVFGSGGLSHFAIDEELDRRFLDALDARDMRELQDLPDNLFRAGTSELKNWIPLASTMFESGLDMTLVDYVPCYRSEAGTGNAMGFAYWR